MKAELKMHPEQFFILIKKTDQKKCRRAKFFFIKNPIHSADAAITCWIHCWIFKWCRCIGSSNRIYFRQQFAVTHSNGTREGVWLHEGVAFWSRIESPSNRDPLLHHAMPIPKPNFTHSINVNRSSTCRISFIRFRWRSPQNLASNCQPPISARASRHGSHQNFKRWWIDAKIICYLL